MRTVIMRAAAAAESELGGSSDAPAGLWDPAVAAGSLTLNGHRSSVQFDQLILSNDPGETSETAGKVHSEPCTGPEFR